MKVLFLIQLIVNIIFSIVIFITLFGFSDLFGISGFLYFGGGAAFFPACLMISVIFLSVYIRDYKPTGLARRISWLELVYSIIVLIILFIWIFGQPIRVFIKDTFSATVSRQAAIKLINECKVTGIVRDDTRTKVFLKKNQNFVYAPSNDFESLRDVFRDTSEKCH